jgi:hypothetical protein
VHNKKFEVRSMKFEKMQISTHLASNFFFFHTSNFKLLTSFKTPSEYTEILQSCGPECGPLKSLKASKHKSIHAFAFLWVPELGDVKNIGSFYFN